MDDANSDIARARTLSDFGDLSPAEILLVDCCRSGLVASIGDACPTRKRRTNSVRAEFVRFLALGGNESNPVHDIGVLLSGAWIDGAVVLDGATLARRLCLWVCRIEEITAVDADLKLLDLRGSRLRRGFRGDRLRSESSIVLGAGFRSGGTIGLPAATIGGDLYLDGAELNHKRECLICESAQIGGNLFMSGVKAKGKACFVRVDVKGDAFLRSSAFVTKRDVSVDFNKSFIAGDLYLDWGFNTQGAVRLSKAQIGGSLWCRSATIVSDDYDEDEDEDSLGGAFICEHMKVKGNVHLDEGFNVTGGMVNLEDAQIGGSLSVDHARVAATGSFALAATNLSISGSLSVFDARLSGDVYMNSAQIGGDANFSRSVIGEPDMSMMGLWALQTRVGRSFKLKNCKVNGGVDLSGAAIEGDLDCRGGSFDSFDPPEDADPSASTDTITSALRFDRARISGSVSLEGVAAKGSVSLSSAVIGGDLICAVTSFEAGSMFALDCSDASVGGTIGFQSIEKVEGIIDLTGASTKSLRDDVQSWKLASGRVVLDGFTYRAFDRCTTKANDRVDWLMTQRAHHLEESFRIQPWEQLISVLRSMGYAEDARQVAIAKEERLRRIGKIPRGVRLLHWLYGRLFGYGYRPLRLLGSLGVVWIACALLYWWAANPGGIGPQVPLIVQAQNEHQLPPNPRSFEPLVYSADVLLPAVNLGYSDEWHPVVTDNQGRLVFAGQLVRYAYWAEIAFGWLAGLMLVASLSNLVKKG